MEFLPLSTADSIIYLEKETGPIDSYHAVFDPKFKGRTSMEDAWINSVIFAAIYLKENSIQRSRIQVICRPMNSVQ